MGKWLGVSAFRIWRLAAFGSGGVLSRLWNAKIDNWVVL